MPHDNTPFNDYSNLFPPLRLDLGKAISNRNELPLRHDPRQFNDYTNRFPPLRLARTAGSTSRQHAAQHCQECASDVHGDLCTCARARVSNGVAQQTPRSFGQCSSCGDEQLDEAAASLDSSDAYVEPIATGFRGDVHSTLRGLSEQLVGFMGIPPLDILPSFPGRLPKPTILAQMRGPAAGATKPNAITFVARDPRDHNPDYEARTPLSVTLDVERFADAFRGVWGLECLQGLVNAEDNYARTLRDFLALIQIGNGGTWPDNASVNQLVLDLLTAWCCCRKGVLEGNPFHGPFVKGIVDLQNAMVRQMRPWLDQDSGAFSLAWAIFNPAGWDPQNLAALLGEWNQPDPDGESYTGAAFKRCCLMRAPDFSLGHPMRRRPLGPFGLPVIPYAGGPLPQAWWTAAAPNNLYLGAIPLAARANRLRPPDQNPCHCGCEIIVGIADVDPPKNPQEAVTFRQVDWDGMRSGTLRPLRLRTLPPPMGVPIGPNDAGMGKSEAHLEGYYVPNPGDRTIEVRWNCPNMSPSGAQAAFFQRRINPITGNEYYFAKCRFGLYVRQLRPLSKDPIVAPTWFPNQGSAESDSPSSFFDPRSYQKWTGMPDPEALVWGWRFRIQQGRKYEITIKVVCPTPSGGEEVVEYTMVIDVPRPSSPW